TYRTFSVTVLEPPFAEAVNWTEVFFEVGFVNRVNVNVLTPAGMFTIALGTMPGFEMVIGTLQPPSGATPVRVTVAITALPPVTIPGDTENDCTAGRAAGGLTVRLTEAVPPFAEAVKLTEAEAETVFVGMLNKALEEPAGIVSVVEATTAVFELVRVTLTPPNGAAADSATVADVALPPVTVVGDRLKPDTRGGGTGLTVNDAVALPPLAEAVRLTPVELVTELVGSERDALDKPAATVKV